METLSLKILVDIPLDDYNNFLLQCATTRPEYEVLKNGIIIQDRQQRPAVQILCDVEDAQKILDLAIAICPCAAAHVQESIALSRPPEAASP